MSTSPTLLEQLAGPPSATPPAAGGNLLEQLASMPPEASAVTNGRVLDSYKAATEQGLENLATAGKNFVTGTLDTLNPKQQPGENALTQIPAVRMVRGIVSALSNGPAALAGVMEAPDKLGFLAQPLSQTAADLGVQTGAAAAVEAAPDAASIAGKVVKKVATPENIGMTAGAYIGHHVGEGLGGAALGGAVGKAVGKAIGERISESAPEVPSPESDIQPTPQSQPKSSPSAETTPSGQGSQVLTDPDAIQARLRDILGKQKPEPKGKAPAVDAEAMKDRLASLENPTDADTLKSRLDEINNPPLSGDELKARIADLKQQLSHSEQFDKVFGQPLENYKNPDGSFNMTDFLQEVVKPGIEPPAHVISRVFGSDGVKLVQDVSGRPIEKWEPTGPTKAERAAKPLSPDTAADFSGRVNNVTPMGSAPMKALQQFAAKHVNGGKLSYLASGGEATVFDLGNGKVMRVASGPSPKIPNIEEVLQPVEQKTVKGATSDYHATVSPKVETEGITQEDVREMTKRLAEKGYQWDAEKHNLGKVNGRLVVIDPGGLDKID